LATWYARARRRRGAGGAASSAAAPTATETLAREIARLDADFERTGSANDAARASYEERRRELKRELASVLDSPGHLS
ncbi:MAG TPA: hypothetical protein VIM15_07910, partial [Gemmatimonadaceae bacterium]